MVLDIIEYIGKNLLTENLYIDTFGANCITTKDGRVVNFIGREKSDFAPTDIVGIGSYARIEPTIEYEDAPTKTSCKQSRQGSIKFRLVVFQVNAVENILNPAKLENKIWGDLQNMSFSSYLGNETQITLKVDSSNLDFSANFRTEVGKDYEVGADSIIIALNCTLTWFATSDNCEVCSVTGVSSLCNNGVEIVDQDGNVVAFVECGRTYTIGNLVPTSRTLTINGVTYDLSDNRSWTVSSGGGETLAQTLVLGNSTGGKDILVTIGDKIKSASGNLSMEFGVFGNVLYLSDNTNTDLLFGQNQFVFNWNNTIATDNITWNSSGYYFGHSTEFEIDAPIIHLTQLTASRLPYIDTSNHLVVSSIQADGNNLFFASNFGIDSVATVGTDVLNIGATNANVINYGNASTTHNFLGTAIYELQVNSYVTDKLMTLNYGGAVASGIGVGFEIEENSVITGYLKTNAARSGYSLKAPANTDYTDFVLTASVPRTKTFQDTSSTIAEYGNKLSVFAATTSSELAGVISDETGSGALVFGTAPTLATPILSSSTSNTAGALGYDGTVFYRTPNANNPGLAPGIHIIRQNATRAVFANNTSVQPLFDSVTNGALTLPVGTYRFKALLSMSGMSGTSGNGSFSIAGSATTGSFLMYVVGVDQTTLATPSNQTGSLVATPAFGTNTVGAAAGTAASMLIEGTFQVTVGGTIIPSFAQTTATAAAVLNIGSFFEIWAVGSTSVVSVGNWS